LLLLTIPRQHGFQFMYIFCFFNLFTSLHHLYATCSNTQWHVVNNHSSPEPALNNIVAMQWQLLTGQQPIAHHNAMTMYTSHINPFEPSQTICLLLLLHQLCS
jgi:hypothetical protein